MKNILAQEDIHLAWHGIFPSPPILTLFKGHLVASHFVFFKKNEARKG